jgi:hypothetical protein
MAPPIFLSWSTPDADRVLGLRNRLEDTGLEVWEYTEDMPGGSQITADIVKTINQVRVAIVCFSDATFDRPWIVTETNWLVKTLRDGDRPLRNIMPIWVGPHPGKKVPTALENEGLRAIDAADASEDQLQRVVGDLFKLLGREAPQIVPAAHFAMTKPQAEALLAGMPNAVLTAACTTAGMTTPPPLAETLAARYGDAPEDLAPFLPGTSLITTINAVLRQANRVRIQRGKRPVFLRWMHNEIVGPAKTNHARKLWAGGDFSLSSVHSVRSPVAARTSLAAPCVVVVAPTIHAAHRSSRDRFVKNRRRLATIRRRVWAMGG